MNQNKQDPLDGIPPDSTLAILLGLSSSDTASANTTGVTGQRKPLPISPGSVAGDGSDLAVDLPVTLYRPDLPAAD